MLGQDIKEKLEELRTLIQLRSESTTVHVSFHLNCEGWETEIRDRTPESLNADSISMRNIKGEWL